MKKSILFSLFFGIFAFIGFTNPVSARSAYIHYYNQPTDNGIVNREPTYSAALPHLKEMKFNVSGYDNAGAGNAIWQMKNVDGPNVFVVHNHGEPGRQIMGSDGSSLVGQNGETILYQSINRVDPLSFRQLRLAIFYGCQTGVTTGKYGDLPGQVVSKGATTSVAWTVSTYVHSVNEWNRLFFEKAKTDNIVESFRHADYWLEQIQGTTYSNIMKQRTERGNIYAFITL